MTEFTIGTRVTAPVSDAEGEVSYIIGELTDLNSRYATIKQSDGTITKVGKSKIELAAPAPEPRKSTRRAHACPKCKGTDQVWDYASVRNTQGIKDHPFASMTRRFWCMDCDCEWGGKINKTTIERPVHYVAVKAASGRASADNGDATAQMLRGMTLPEVYDKAAEVLGVKRADLESRYIHLNPGQQRMNLGNRIRKALREV